MNRYDSIKRKLALSLAHGKAKIENATHGEFIKQTNEVQFILAYVVLTRPSFVDEDYRNWLVEKAGLGTLINLFRACIRRTPSMYLLFLQLQKYKKDRDRLAHKMFSPKKLTPAESERALSIGEEILKRLYKLAKIPKRPRSTISKNI